MARNIRLADGTVYPVDRCGADGERLRLRVTDGLFLLTAAVTFSAPEKTYVIEHYFDGTETDHVFFEGYTVLLALSVEAGGIAVLLKKGE